jgi:hypothetical protein
MKPMLFHYRCSRASNLPAFLFLFMICRVHNLWSLFKSSLNIVSSFRANIFVHLGPHAGMVRTCHCQLYIQGFILQVISI